MAVKCDRDRGKERDNGVIDTAADAHLIESICGACGSHQRVFALVDYIFVPSHPSWNWSTVQTFGAILKLQTTTSPRSYRLKRLTTFLAGKASRWRVIFLRYFRVALKCVKYFCWISSFGGEHAIAEHASSRTRSPLTFKTSVREKKVLPFIPTPAELYACI